MKSTNKNYIIGITLCMIIINSITYFGLFIGGGSFFLFVQFLNSVVMPIWLANHLNLEAKLRKKKHFIPFGLVLITCYLLTYLIPLYNDIDFLKFTLKMDGEGKALFFLFIGFGLIVNLILILRGEIILYRTNSELK